jgi:PPK2 family polyphosphate:nucleotide phosphotransferase
MGDRSKRSGAKGRGREDGAGARSICDLHRVEPGSPLVLSELDPSDTPGIGDEERARAEVPETVAETAELQERLWVEGERSLLVVLQGMDTSGKGGTVEHVFQGLNPAGVDVTSFKQPTAEELRHHFLWRIRRRLPQPGQIVIFDRSHYEDVLIVRVDRLLPDAELPRRYREIVRFEERVAARGTTILKFFLCISYDEQRERLLARLDEPLKRWKFREGDLETRARWPEFVAAYEDAIRFSSTDTAPWYVIPADRKWYRNWAVSRIVLETLRDMNPKIPIPDLDVEDLKRRLAPPN